MKEGIVADLDLFGQGIVKSDEKIYFVKNALVGEKVRFVVEKTAKRCGFGFAEKIIKSSEARILPPCPHFGVCGGCQFQHCDYDAEVDAKENHVKNTLKRIGGLETISLTPMEREGKIFGYRNKVTWHMKDGKTGFYKENSNEFLPINHCLLLAPALNEVTKYLNNEEFSKVKSAVLRCNEKGEVAIIIEGWLAKSAARNLLSSVSALISVTTEQEVFGEESFLLTLGNSRYYASPQSFFQVNTKMAKEMFDYVGEILGKERQKTLLDLYCGVGTVGIYLGDRFEKVYGIESYAPATKFARKNAKINQIDGEYFTAKAEDGLGEILNKLPKADCVIVDPPRKGLHPNVVAALLKEEIPSLVYISCDPGTLSRDLKALKESYDIVSAKPFNLFPRTGHVECVVLITRVKE